MQVPTVDCDPLRRAVGDHRDTLDTAGGNRPTNDLGGHSLFGVPNHLARPISTDRQAVAAEQTRFTLRRLKRITAWYDSDIQAGTESGFFYDALLTGWPSGGGSSGSARFSSSGGWEAASRAGKPNRFQTFWRTRSPRPGRASTAFRTQRFIGASYKRFGFPPNLEPWIVLLCQVWRRQGSSENHFIACLLSRRSIPGLLMQNACKLRGRAP